MCLTVTHIPRTWQHGLIQPCCKWLVNDGFGLVTPTMNASPLGGWLFARRRLSSANEWPRDGDRLGGEAVHGYVDRDAFPAFMFGVLGWQECGELSEARNQLVTTIAGRAMWVPGACCDATKFHTESAIKRIRRVLTRDRTLELLQRELQPAMTGWQYAKFVKVMRDY